MMTGEEAAKVLFLPWWRFGSGRNEPIFGSDWSGVGGKHTGLDQAEKPTEGRIMSALVKLSRVVCVDRRAYSLVRSQQLL